MNDPEKPSEFYPFYWKDLHDRMAAVGCDEETLKQVYQTFEEGAMAIVGGIFVLVGLSFWVGVILSILLDIKRRLFR